MTKNGDLAQQLLGIYGKVDAFLRRQPKTDRHADHSYLIQQVARTNHIIAKYEPEEAPTSNPGDAFMWWSDFSDRYTVAHLNRLGARSFSDVSSLTKPQLENVLEERSVAEVISQLGRRGLELSETPTLTPIS